MPADADSTAGGSDDSSFDILGIGMSMMDSIQVVDEFPSGAGITESPVATLMGGGPVPTALCAASVLGVRAGIIDQIGGDWCSDLILKDYARFGVDCRYLHRQDGRSSTYGSVMVRRSDGERHIVFTRGTFDELSLSQLPVKDLEACPILHLNGRHWDCACEAARIVKAGGGRVSFDGGANRYESRFLPLLEEVDILIVARDFAEKLSNSTDREAQMAALGQWGAEIVGITDGEKGSWFLPRGERVFHQPAFAVSPVVDTTGCGDVFHGAFLASLSRGSSWRDCAAFASAAAACNVLAPGGRGNLPTVEKVAERLNFS
ncbi:MAG: PfkB family carbohydrate kinase [Verrucomicrobiales bacterium]|nr:PfkB family carbohydrate kinase [Verrucomicrobiales bacterium]